MLGLGLPDQSIVKLVPGLPRFNPFFPIPWPNREEEIHQCALERARINIA